MKNLKKLVIASFMLVIAFVAVVSSTYAWFTTSSDARVNDITIGVVDADAALLISKTGAVDSWSGNAAIVEKRVSEDALGEGDFYGMFTPVTMARAGVAADPKFVKINSTYDFDAAQDIKAGTYSAQNPENVPSGYLTFDLYFQVTITQGEQFSNYNFVMDITSLDATNEGQTGSNHHAISSFRLAVAPAQLSGNQDFSITKIVEGVDATQTGRYNDGVQFSPENAWMALYGSHRNAETTEPDPLVIPNDETNKYELATNYKNALEQDAVLINTAEGQYEYSINCGNELFRDNCYETSYTANALIKYFKVRIYVWMEGWDGDCVNAAAGCQYKFSLQFSVKHTA